MGIAAEKKFTPFLIHSKLALEKPGIFGPGRKLWSGQLTSPSISGMPN
jgi:hypothetical protein